MKKLIVALGAIATTASLLTAVPAQARPHMACKRVWVHGHPERRCHPVGPMYRHHGGARY